MTYQPYKLVGVNPLGNILEVALYADDQESAGRQFDFRYGALGYRREGEAPRPQRGNGKRERRRKGTSAKEGPPPGKETDGGRSPYTQKSQASD